MKVSVFDTYVRKHDGGLMHFDIIVPIGTETAQVYAFGKTYLDKKGQAGDLSAQECQFCHVEELQPQMAGAIIDQGYFVVELQGC